MAIVRIPRFPHLTWLDHELAIRRPRIMVTYASTHVSHRLLLATEGIADIEWISRGAGRRFQMISGQLAFFPRDGREHSLMVTSASGFRVRIVGIPEAQLSVGVASAATDGDRSSGRAPGFDDRIARAFLDRVAPGGGASGIGEGIGDEFAARNLLVRLEARFGGAVAGVATETGCFTPVTMRSIVVSIDSHLASRSPPSAMAERFGFSATHFSRMFRRSTGFSMERFRNHRRIRRSLGLLQDDAHTLAEIAPKLGFSSQSHFTRVFSQLTGISPGRFQRLDRPFSG